MKPSEAFPPLEAAKAGFVQSITRSLQAVPNVASVTFTGSFVEKPGLSSISDIDVVVVVRNLNETCLKSCHRAVGLVSPSLLGLPGHRVVINDTFGPLKFDEPGVIVIHLMVYDVPGHREHVLKSPFTCLDWERSTFHTDRSLRDIYPVLALQPRQFFEARRSLGNYVEDIAAGVLSYRRHQFDGEQRSEAVERLPLDRRHQGEYGYHIVRNLVANYAKLIQQQNRFLSDAELPVFWRRHLPGCADFIPWFEFLGVIKRARRSDYPDDTTARTREFLAAFARQLEQTWTKHAVRHRFVRHARTKLNDSSFLGQRRDPSIEVPPAALSEPPLLVFTSPSLRCRQTAAALAPGAEPRIESRLHEIDYGAAEGLDYASLVRTYPTIAAGWRRGEDPRFPEGENTDDVHDRLQSFIATLGEQPALVVSHNVVLRCLLGSGLNIPRHQWYLIPVDHLESVSLFRLDGRNYLDLTPDQLMRITDALVAHRT